ncbi:MAG: pectate lyase, partial [Hyphomonadaceae bacterium]
MKRATRFMLERVAHEGGYVWSYFPDLSRRWGEMEAYPTMQWVQPPGTGTMGHIFLDAYAATRDSFYIGAAESAARALVRGQDEAGGWNYMIDTAGEASLRRWYDTIGKNGWRLEEFHHYWGNATFDDACTADCTQFLIRLLAHRRAGWIERAAARAIDFVLASQLPSGGWPQRFPRAPGELAYPSYLTFNDDVAGENIKTLIMARELLGRADLDDALRAGMNSYPLAQYRAPQ